jgi:adenine-specific DNA glycosylase
VRRAKPTPRRFAAFVASRNNRLLVRQRPAGVVNAHLWEFPNTELALTDTDLEGAARQALGRGPIQLIPLCAFKHSITRYRITLEAFRAELNGDTWPGPADGRWLTRAELERLPFASAHKKLLRQVTS